VPPSPKVDGGWYDTIPPRKKSEDIYMAFKNKIAKSPANRPIRTGRMKLW